MHHSAKVNPDQVQDQGGTRVKHEAGQSVPSALENHLLCKWYFMNQTYQFL